MIHAHEHIQQMRGGSQAQLFSDGDRQSSALAAQPGV